MTLGHNLSGSNIRILPAPSSTLRSAQREGERQVDDDAEAAIRTIISRDHATQHRHVAPDDRQGASCFLLLATAQVAWAEGALVDAVSRSAGNDAKYVHRPPM